MKIFTSLLFYRTEPASPPQTSFPLVAPPTSSPSMSVEEPVILFFFPSDELSIPGSGFDSLFFNLLK
jgi:hypothetical protein